MQCAECSVQDAGCRMQCVVCRMQCAVCRMRGAVCSVQDAVCGAQDAGCGAVVPRSRPAALRSPLSALRAPVPAPLSASPPGCRPVRAGARPCPGCPESPGSPHWSRALPTALVFLPRSSSGFLQHLRGPPWRTPEATGAGGAVAPSHPSDLSFSREGRELCSVFPKSLLDSGR